MSDLDSFVLCWWVSAIGLAAFSAVCLRQKGESAAPRSSLFAVGLLVAVAIFLLVVGLFGLVWNLDKTKLLVWNFWIVIFLVSIFSIPISLSLAPFTGEGWRFRRPSSRGARFLFALVGFAVALFSAYVLVADWTFQRLIVTGRVDDIVVERRKNTSYYVVIDGKKLRATQEVLFGLKTGEQVRAEIGAGSKMVFHTEPIDRTLQSK